MPKPGHRDEVDLVTVEHVDHVVGVRDAVEVAPETRPLDHLHGDAGCPGDLDGTTFAVDHDDDDREVGGQEGVQDRAAARCQHPNPPHVGNVAQPLGEFRVLEVRPTACSD